MFLLFLGIGLIFSGMAMLWRFRLIDPESFGTYDFRFKRATDRTFVSFTEFRLVRLLGAEDTHAPARAKYAIVKLDGRYWLLQGVDSCHGIYPWLLKSNGK